jgi:hypothetical protein
LSRGDEKIIKYLLRCGKNHLLPDPPFLQACFAVPQGKEKRLNPPY